MYRSEWLPRCLSMGISEELFWTLNPYKIQAYTIAKKIKFEETDTYLWILGSYVFEGVSTALGNLFRGKGRSAVSYRDKPYHEEANEQNTELSHEDIVKQTESLFAALSVMKANYELDKKLEG